MFTRDHFEAFHTVLKPCPIQVIRKEGTKQKSSPRAYLFKSTIFIFIMNYPLYDPLYEGYQTPVNVFLDCFYSRVVLLLANCVES